VHLHLRERGRPAHVEPVQSYRTQLRAPRTHRGRRRSERGVRVQRVQRIGRVPVPRLQLYRRRVLELRLGFRLGLGLGRRRGGRRGCLRGLWLKRGRVAHSSARRERARGPCRQARARRGRVGWCERGGRGGDGRDGEDASGAVKVTAVGARDTLWRCSRVVRLFVSLASLARPLAILAAAHPSHSLQMHFMTLYACLLCFLACLPCSGSSEPNVSHVTLSPICELMHALPLATLSRDLIPRLGGFWRPKTTTMTISSPNPIRQRSPAADDATLRAKPAPARSSLPLRCSSMGPRR
jgi:hypothetical protein